MSILLDRGQRGILIGRTGSGKTTGAIFQLQNTPIDNVIVFDTKGEPAFNKLARENESIEFYDSNESFAKELKQKRLPNYMVVRPDELEMADSTLMDAQLLEIYSRSKSCLVYIDEAYQWHVRGQAGAGLIGLLTRGRSKGITTLMSTQRPAWISRFCFTEAERYYIYKLTSLDDRKTVASYVPGYDPLAVVAKHFFWYYDSSSDMENPQYFKPVPLPVRAKAANEESLVNGRINFI